MSKEGSTQAPTRHPLKFRDPDFINPEKIDQEMRRVFDICHGCRRCFNLCDSFPKLFDYIDETEGGEVSDLSSDKFKPVVDACTLCDMCFMTKCPYVPPHDFDLDFPHLMLRYRTAQRKNGDISKTANQLTQIIRDFVYVPQGIFVNSSFIGNAITGLIIALIVASVIFGGIQRIAKVASKLVPIMVGLYLFAALIILSVLVASIWSAIAISSLAEELPRTSLKYAVIAKLTPSLKLASSPKL